jgi:hypothetical protein
MSIVKLNNKAVSNATVIGSISSLGSMTFIKKLTASSSATLSFVDGTDGVVLDDTYKEYYFTFNNIHPSEQGFFTFNLSIDSGSNYNVTKTSTFFYADHAEGDTEALIAYRTADDLAQSTAFQSLCSGDTMGLENDENFAGYLQLFNPSSTTFIKHFMARSIFNSQGNFQFDNHIAGYGNTTSAVDAVRFQMDSGNIDAGDICLYGIA